MLPYFRGCGFKLSDIISVTIFLLCGLFYLTELYLSWTHGHEAFMVRLDSFLVSNLTTTTDLVSASWDAELTIGNTREDTDIDVKTLSSFIHYGKTPLLCTLVKGFHLRRKSERRISLYFQENGCGDVEQMYEKENILEDFKEENYEGDVDLHLSIIIDATFRKKTIWIFTDYYYSVCGNIRLKFGATAATVLMTQHGPYLCRVASKDLLK